ncbi:hypothetical protein BZA77DRAFT_290534 [Pyronema omphalodes]|nr:hypothetical protein BZA77DRAFT_290534 [Pyronema omphalodes]
MRDGLLPLPILSGLAWLLLFSALYYINPLFPLRFHKERFEPLSGFRVLVSSPASTTAISFYLISLVYRPPSDLPLIYDRDEPISPNRGPFSFWNHNPQTLSFSINSTGSNYRFEQLSGCLSSSATLGNAIFLLFDFPVVGGWFGGIFELPEMTTAMRFGVGLNGDM